jgi:hypothetical protein
VVARPEAGRNSSQVGRASSYEIGKELDVGDINLEVWDATGNKRLRVQVPNDVSVERILMVLADKLHLPRYAPDGQLMSYKFHHRRLGVQLLDDQTLAHQNVIDDDIVRIQPEITAGSQTSTRGSAAR